MQGKIDDKYSANFKHHNNLYNTLKKKVNRISNQRLICAILAIATIIYMLFSKTYTSTTFIALGILVIAFIILVFYHEHVYKKMYSSKILAKINKNAIDRKEGKFNLFEDDGAEFIDDEHNFSTDLDLFGKNSIFQWINVANTSLGRIKLKNLLVSPIKNKKSIKLRQEAIKELANKLEFRQAFQAAGSKEKDNMNNSERLIDWSMTSNNLYCQNWLSLIVFVLPFVTITCIIGCVVKIVPLYIVVLLLIMHIVMLGLRFRDMNSILVMVDKYRKDIKCYEEMVELIEKNTFESKYLNIIIQRMQRDKHNTVKTQIKKLDKILDNISWRHSQLYIIMNILILWDYHCVIALESWKKDFGIYVSMWIDAIGEFEALSSLSNIAYDNPDWAMPDLVDNKRICAHKLGHPLLSGDKRVCNNVDFGKNNVLLITGSNMSGKSTFLRTVGINLVLAYAGAPVCAEWFTCPILQIYTSMRTKDDLEKNVSSFYAELIRIKMIIDAAKRDENIFFLLDEIFKGTNSRDRHTGAKTLIKKLSKENAIGLVSTHDLELSELAKENNSKIVNYHFQEYYQEGKIFFDYKLYRGVSMTLNAVYLMKQIGIEIE